MLRDNVQLGQINELTRFVYGSVGQNRASLWNLVARNQAKERAEHAAKLNKGKNGNERKVMIIWCIDTFAFGMAIGYVLNWTIRHRNRMQRR